MTDNSQQNETHIDTLERQLLTDKPLGKLSFYDQDTVGDFIKLSPERIKTRIVFDFDHSDRLNDETLPVRWSPRQKAFLEQRLASEEGLRFIAVQNALANPSAPLPQDEKARDVITLVRDQMDRRREFTELMLQGGDIRDPDKMKPEEKEQFNETVLNISTTSDFNEAKNGTYFKWVDELHKDVLELLQREKGTQSPKSERE